MPMTSGELSKDAIGIPYDKRALMRGDPTSRTEKIDPKTMLEDLAKQFVKIVEMNEPKTIIDGEIIPDSIESLNNVEHLEDLKSSPEDAKNDPLKGT